jgi:hypothetical protein
MGMFGRMVMEGRGFEGEGFGGSMSIFWYIFEISKE